MSYRKRRKFLIVRSSGDETTSLGNRCSENGKLGENLEHGYQNEEVENLRN